MTDINIDAKDEKKDEEIIEEEQCGCNNQEEQEEASECSQDEEACGCDEDDEKVDYKVYGKQKAEDYKEFGKQKADETRDAAEKIINDIYNTLKSKQKELNKNIEEYTANKPPVDVVEYENEIKIYMDVPRASKEDLSVNVTADNVEIIVSFPELYEEDEDIVKVLRKERCVGKTKNIVPLPADIVNDKVSASFEDGQLTITLPKIQPKKVEVEIV